MLGLTIFVAIFAGRRRTLNSDIALRALPTGGVRYWSTAPAGHPRVDACARCHARLHGSARLWCSALSYFVQVVTTRMVTACSNSELSVALARPQTRQKLLLAPQPRIASLHVQPSWLLDGLQVAYTLPSVIMLVDWRDFPQYHIIADRARAAMH